MNLEHDTELFGDKKNVVMRNLYLTSKLKKPVDTVAEAKVVEGEAEGGGTLILNRGFIADVLRCYSSEHTFEE